MAWNSDGDGPWGGGGQGGGSGPRGPQPPDIDELIRRSQEKVKRLLPSGGGSVRTLVLIGLAVIVLWFGINVPYQVKPGEVGVELLFGNMLNEQTLG